MKFGVWHIICEHVKTLYDDRTKAPSFGDMATFFVTPLLAGSTAYGFGLEMRPDSFNVSITFFGIFIALLLNIQVAIFSIFQRKWDTSESKTPDEPIELLEIRRRILSELSTNISYLIILCSFSLVFFFIIFVSESRNSITSAVSVAIYTHFFATFLMIIKRSYALFKKEYDR